MDTEALLSRIWSRPDTFGGKPTVRDTRISVELILALLTQGETVEMILDDYAPELEAEDIRACFAYAYQAIAAEEADLAPIAAE